ncbi:hypothetical protein AHF37_10977, partial [Paragonimus kellicotti]
LKFVTTNNPGAWLYRNGSVLLNHTNSNRLTRTKSLPGLNPFMPVIHERLLPSLDRSSYKERQTDNHLSTKSESKLPKSNEQEFIGPSDERCENMLCCPAKSCSSSL